MLTQTTTNKITPQHAAHVVRILKEFDQLGFDYLMQAYHALWSDNLDLWDFSGINIIDALTIVDAHKILAPNYNHDLLFFPLITLHSN